MVDMQYRYRSSQICRLCSSSDPFQQVLKRKSRVKRWVWPAEELNSCVSCVCAAQKWEMFLNWMCLSHSPSGFCLFKSLLFCSTPYLLVLMETWMRNQAEESKKNTSKKFLETFYFERTFFIFCVFDCLFIYFFPQVPTSTRVPWHASSSTRTLSSPAQTTAQWNSGTWRRESSSGTWWLWKAAAAAAWCGVSAPPTRSWCVRSAAETAQRKPSCWCWTLEWTWNESWGRGAGHVWRTKRADCRDEGTEREWWGAWKPEGRHPETLHPKLARSAGTVANSRLSRPPPVITRIPPFWGQPLLTKTRLLIPFSPVGGWRGGWKHRFRAQASPSLVLLKKREERRSNSSEVTLRLSGSGSASQRLGVAKISTDVEMYREILFFKKKFPTHPLLNSGTPQTRTLQKQKSVQRIGKDLRKVGDVWGEFPHSVTPKVLLDLVEWKEVLGAFIFFTPFPFLLFSTRFL